MGTGLKRLANRADFTFSVTNKSDGELKVVEFAGAEALSELFEWRIMLCSDNPDLDLDAYLNQPATLTIDGDAGKRYVNGIIRTFERVGDGTSVTYYAAEIVPVTDTMTTNCGPFGPYDNPAAFCPLEDAIYYSVPLSSDVSTQVGDFAWITVLAHEWGHHVQLLMGIEAAMSMERELQADCFAGAYAQRALLNGFLQEGDVTEAVVMNILGGDPVELSETAQGAHGSSDYRVTAFMQGYFNGADRCFENPSAGM